MYALFWLVNTALDIYWWFIIIHVIISWLTTFGVINTYQPFVQTVSHFLYNVVEPAARPIRRFMPNLGGVDLSVLILLVLVRFVQIFINTSIAPIFL